MGGNLSTESKRREVLQLLRDYRTWHSGFGAAIAWEDSHIAQAAYGPGGMILVGAEYRDYSTAEVERLAKSYEYLEYAITIEKATPEGFAAWVLLHGPYFGDPADPDMVRVWREIGDYRIEWHDRFWYRLAHHLRHRKLYPIEPRYLTESENTALENRDAEIYAAYQHHRVAHRMRHRAAVEEVAKEFRVPTGSVETVIEFRRNVKADECMEAGCDRAPFSQNLCMKHYQKRRRSKQAC